MRTLASILLTTAMPLLLAVTGTCLGGWAGFWLLAPPPGLGCGNMAFPALLTGAGLGYLGFVGGLIVGENVAEELTDFLFMEPVDGSSKPDSTSYYQPPP